MKANPIKTVPAGEFKTHCLSLLDDVAAGQIIRVTKRGKPVAELVPVPKAKVSLKPLRGAGKGYLRITGNIVSPAADEDEWAIFNE